MSACEVSDISRADSAETEYDLPVARPVSVPVTVPLSIQVPPSKPGCVPVHVPLSVQVPAIHVPSKRIYEILQRQKGRSIDRSLCNSLAATLRQRMGHKILLALASVNHQRGCPETSSDATMSHLEDREGRRPVMAGGSSDKSCQQVSVGDGADQGPCASQGATAGLGHGESAEQRQRRFLRTAEMLRRSGMLDVTMKTAELIRQNQKLQRELEVLQDETKAFVQTVLSSPDTDTLARKADD